MPSFAALGRSVGDFGNQVGQASDINLNWKQRLQQMAMENARQKLADLMGPLQLQEVQQRIKQMQQPREVGIVKGPGGETSGVTFDPATSSYSVKTLIPGAPPEPKFPTLQAAAAYYLQRGDFDKLKLVNDEIDRTKPQPKAAPEPKDAFELWRAQNPTASVGDWMKLQEQYKKPSADPNAAFDRWQKEQEYKAAHPPAKPGKPVPPDVQALLSAPVPKDPTPEESRRLADAADRIFGGTAYKQDLMGRGRRASWPFVGTFGRAPYASVAYDAKEYSDILDSVKSGASRGMDANDPSLSGFSEVVK